MTVTYERKSVEAILLVDAATDDDDDANVGVEAGESVEREASSVKVEVTNELGPGVRAHITNSHSHRSDWPGSPHLPGARSDYSS